MQSNLIRIFLTLFLLIPSIVLKANINYKNTIAQNLRFERLSMENGLSNNTILTIFQDKKGFIWFGTEDGLNRYDGYNCKVYKNDPDDSTSISGKKIYSIIEDSSGGLWLGTDAGLNYFDRNIEVFTHWKSDPENPNSLPNNTILNILKDPAGNKSVMWFATLKGLSRFDYSTGEFRNYLYKTESPMKRFLNMIFTMIESKSGGLWLGTYRGLIHFDLENESFTDHSSVKNMILSLYEDDNGNLWMGLGKAGLKIYNPKNKQVISLRNKYFIRDDPF